MDSGQVKNYWEKRASSDSSAQSTTLDYYLREIEFRVVKEMIGRYRPTIVMDVGCGDARTTSRLAADFSEIAFVGGDYSETMVKNAQKNIEQAGINNLNVTLCDVSQPLRRQQLDMLYSTRCLINLPTWESQQIAIQNITNALKIGGLYVMIENFTEGQENMNQVRVDLGLPEIPVRKHNLFISRTRLLDFVSKDFEVVEETNISSTYYLVSRAIYSKICQDSETIPDYFDVHHNYHLPASLAQ